MKRKILLAVSCIGVFSIAAIIYADLAFSNTTSILSVQEMAESFGKGECSPDCTLGDMRAVHCNQSGCGGCQTQGMCTYRDYGTGNYYYLCKTGILDGYCVEDGLVDCYRSYSCNTVDGMLYPRDCKNGDCIYNKDGNYCSECSKGDPFMGTETKMSYTCNCGA